MDKELIAYLVYECEDIEEVKKKVKAISDEETLFAFMNNYNWDDGFDIPSIALKSKHCKLATALKIFYDAGGGEALMEKSLMRGSDKWAKFVKGLYAKIIENKYEQGSVGYNIPLSKLKRYKLAKTFSEKEMIIISDLDGIDATIRV